MRKWIVLLVVIAVAALGSLYLFIPNRLSIKQHEAVFFPAKAFSRALFNEMTWQQWWPGTEKTANTFRYNGNTYSIIEKKLSSLLITVGHDKDTLQTELVVIPVETDSIELEWLAAANNASNPISRMQKNRWVKNVATDMGTLLQKMKAFYTNPDNLYTFPVREERVKDSTLISTSTIVKGYPSTAQVYSLLDKLKAHAENNGAKQTGLPMLNITPGDDSTYLARVALPIDKKIPNAGDIQYRWMLGGGNILVTEAKGGPQAIKRAFVVLEEYINDFNRVAPAIPFQSLVTDRRNEPDTAKWVTKVYWPVM